MWPFSKDEEESSKPDESSGVTESGGQEYSEPANNSLADLLSRGFGRSLHRRQRPDYEDTTNTLPE